MPDNNEVAGRLGDISGRMGDISGRMGDISGRLGDISGSAGVEEVQEALMLDREADKLKCTLECTEARIRRLETEVVLLARWTDVQLVKHTVDVGREVSESVQRQDDRLNRFDERLRALENQLRALAPKPPQT